MSVSSPLRAVGMEALFQPFRVKSVRLSNRIVMAPMTRMAAPGGVVGPANAAYYRRRAEGGVGLIITEGTWIPHPVAGFHADIPEIDTLAARAAWRGVVEAVHETGVPIFLQLWHVGIARRPGDSPNPELPAVSPSGIGPKGKRVGDPMSAAAIGEVIEAYGNAAVAAQEVGFDGIEIHAAHGYLVDQFFWDGTNHRTDRYGGDLVARTGFAADIIRECRRRTGPDFAIGIRLSQWKSQDYDAKLVHSPQEFERFLAPLADAGADIFHISTRRYWDAGFEGDRRTLAGWAKKLTGKTVIAVGSVGLDQAFNPQQAGMAEAARIDGLIELMERGDIDLIAAGRALIANPRWPEKIRGDAWDELVAYSPEMKKILI